MTATRAPRSRWIEEGFRALATGGPEAVRVESLARALGVTKGSFYWHFADRGALLDELLLTWERTLVDEVVERVERDGGAARARLGRLFALAAVNGELTRVELAIRDWARRDRDVAKRLRRVDNRRMAYLRSLFGELGSSDEEAEARSLLAMSLFVSNHLIAADHGGRSRRTVLESATAMLLA